MGMFKNALNNAQKAMGEAVYNETKLHLAPKDGKVHVVMVNSFSKWANQCFCCEDKYTNNIDTLLSAMQDDGYEIIDIKFSVLQNQGLHGEMEGFNTLILYR